MAEYSNEFKKEALKLSNKVGVKKAVAQLGLSYYTLADWRNRTRKQITGETKTNVKRADPVTQAARIRELERENTELCSANDILKDALVFSQKTGRGKSFGTL